MLHFFQNLMTDIASEFCGRTGAGAGPWAGVGLSALLSEAGTG